MYACKPFESLLGEILTFVSICCSFFFLFMAYNTAQSLQTTLSENKTLALAALGVLYGALCMTTVIAPKIVQKLGPKRSMIFGSMPYVLFVFFSSNPTWATLIPASFLVGIGGGVLWNGHGVYMSRCALHQSLQSKQPVDTMTTRLNSWFYCAQMVSAHMCYQSQFSIPYFPSF